MQFRLRIAAVLAGTAGVVGLMLVPHALGGRQVELLQCLDEIPTLVGTSGNDVLTGTVGDDVIAGFGGDDVILGSWGNDVICGGDGDDRITAGLGLFEVNLVSGDAGDDEIVAGGTSTVVVYAFAPGSVKVDVAAGTATGWGDDTLDGVERRRRIAVRRCAARQYGVQLPRRNGRGRRRPRARRRRLSLRRDRRRHHGRWSRGGRRVVPVRGRPRAGQPGTWDGGGGRAATAFQGSRT